MLTTLGIVEVRRDGRDWGISRKLGGKSILEWVTRRATDCERLDRVVVLCDDDDAHAVRQLVPSDVQVLTNEGSDALAATVRLCDRFHARSVVHLSADHPFIDPVLVDRLVSTADAHPDCDYIGYCRGDGRPTILTHLGIFAEWCSAAALAVADRQATAPADRKHLTTYVLGHPERFSMRLIPMPEELDREDLRLHVGGVEDWEHAQVIYEALGPDEWDWRRITELLHSQPALRKRMAALNREAQRV